MGINDDRNFTVADILIRQLKKPSVTFNIPRAPISSSPKINKEPSTGGDALLHLKSPRKSLPKKRVQTTMKTAHSGRKVNGKVERKVKVLDVATAGDKKIKRCSFITSNSDPLYVKYHDEEWGVPVHDDNRLFELLTLITAQIGSDWTTILKKRERFRFAFSGFNLEQISTFNEKQIGAASRYLDLDSSRVRHIVKNSSIVLEIKNTFGSFDRYLWMFVNFKPISPMYNSCRKIPGKTSKSLCISNDMRRRGFQFVGPTVIHLFMQAAGLTNNHIVSCAQHSRRFK